MNPFADLINTGGQQGQGGVPDYSQLFTEFRKQPVQQKKKKNFWLDQISTAGGILGGIGGSFIAPIAGTAGGAAAGSALGEAIEKMIDPNSTDWGNVAQEGIIGGIMGAGPIKLLKGAGAGAKALATGADDVVGVASKAALTPLRQTAGKAVAGKVDDMAIKNFRLNPGQVTQLNKKLGEDTGSFIRRYGFQSADDVAAKGIQPLQAEFDGVVSGLTKIPKTQIKSQLDEIIKPLRNSVSLQEQTLAKNIQSQADEFLKKTGSTLSGQEVLKFRQLFDDGVKYTMRGTPEFNVSKGMADGLRKTLQVSADRAGLKASNGRSLKEMGSELSKLIQLDEVITKQSNLGRGSLPLNLPTLLGGVAGGAAFGPAGIGTAGAVAAVNSNTGRRLAMSGAEKVASKLSATKGGQSALGIAGRIGATGMLGGAGASGSQEDTMLDPQSLENSASNPNANPNSMAPMSASMMGEQYQTQQDVSSPFAPQNLESAIMQIMQQGGDMGDVSKFLTVAKTMQELTGGNQAQAKPLSQGQQERADLIKALDNTEGIMSTGSINYGPIGSRVEGVKSMFNAADPETLAFKNTVSGLRAAITKARAGASLTPGELKMLAQYTPSDTDSEQVVRSKLAQLRGLYGYQAPTGGGSSLEDAIMQSQYSYQ